jgi:putative hydrolase of the HAD superfamily
MIKAIIFDNNGVLTSCDADDTIPGLAKYFGIEDVKAFGETYNELVIPADLGEITTDNFLKDLVAAVGKEYNHGELWKLFRGSYVPKDGARDMLYELKKHCQIALLTNFVDVFDEFNNEVWHYDDIFEDNMFVSSKLGMIKPHDDIFLYTLDKLGRKPNEAIFIDDRQSNVEAAENLGIKGILFESIDQLKRDLSAELGSKILV